MSALMMSVNKPNVQTQADPLEKLIGRNEAPLVFLDYQEDWTANVVSKIKAQTVGTHAKAKFECSHCGIKLLSEAGLEEHLQRRSIEVRLPCIKCNIVHICYNPCQVLNVMKLCDTEVSWGVPVEEVRPQIAGLPISLKEPDPEAPSSGKFRAEELIRATRTCHECRVFCAEDSLEAHMSFSTGLKSTCQTCGQRMPTRCAQQAHWRLHKLSPPFVCPECGKLAPRDTQPEEFKHHVNEICHHRERVLVYQCPNCPSVHERDRDLAAHIADAHVQMLYKCSLCSLAFKDTTAFFSHSNKTHSYSTATPVSVIKCPMCEACVFADTEMLIQHFLSIHTSTCSKFVFRCHICRQLRTDQLAIHEHHKAEHAWQPLYPDVMAPAEEKSVKETGSARRNRKAEQNNKDKEKTAYSLVQGALLRCLKCAFESTNRVQFLQHIRTHKEGETSHQCSDCGVYLSSEKGLEKHLHDAHDIKSMEEHLKLIKELIALIVTKEEPLSRPSTASPAGKPPLPNAANTSNNNNTTKAADRNSKKAQRPKCLVCNLSCTDAKALEFHMRTHGTAFLKNYNKQRKN